jgi:mono/diheme cytochrome c family protein
MLTQAAAESSPSYTVDSGPRNLGNRVMASMLRQRLDASSRLQAVVGGIVIACIAMLTATSVEAAPAAMTPAPETAVLSASEHGSSSAAATGNRQAIADNSKRLLTEGRRVFRFETFGDEAWWTDTLRLHEAIEGKNHGGVGGGVSPATALAVGLKVDVDALPKKIQKAISRGEVDLDDPAVTLLLLKLDAVLGIKATLRHDGNVIESMGVTCALCHSTVDNSFAPGIGHRLDGWPNRDLNVGLIVSLAPNLQPIADLLLTDVATVKRVLTSWGPGRYDAWLDKDGKAFRPDGGQAGTLLPPAYGLAGVNLHTWTGSGSVPYWNAYVAATQMHGTEVTFYDPRLSDPVQYPVAARSGSWNTRGTDPARASDKLDALHYYQISIPAPKAPKGSFNAGAAARGKALFVEKAQCASCHVPPAYTEPGYAIHTPEEIGIDGFQADRSPTHGYRTAPLAGLWSHQKGGFYHDGRFATLADVVKHYDDFFQLNLTPREKEDLIQFLLSI